MRKVHCGAFAVAALLSMTNEGSSEDSYILRQEQSGLTLPGVSLPQGFDEVRAADGASCRSSNTGTGAYADVGVIGSNSDTGKLESRSLYGRVVIPLGANGTRLDCRKLYDLEIQRLQMEVRLLKAGLNPGVGREQVGAIEKADDGWGNAGRDATPTGDDAIAQAPQPAAPIMVRRAAPSAPTPSAPRVAGLAAGGGLRGTIGVTDDPVR